MKKQILLLFVLPLFSISLSAQEVPEVQQSLITKITATWCGNCGTWGWAFFEDLLEDNSDKALLIANHYSGDLTNDASEAIADNLVFSGQPKFFINNTDQFVKSNEVSVRRTEIKDKVGASFMMSPVVNAGLEAALDGDQLTVKTKTKFFQAASGAYYVGVYLIEDGVINFQSGQGSNAVHHNVMRASMSSNAFGEVVMDGSISMGMEFDHEFTLTMDSKWDASQLTIATIVWKKEDDVYQFVNTHSTTEIGISTTAVQELRPEVLGMQLNPTISRGYSQLSLNIEADQKHLSLKVYDQLGRTVAVLHRGALSAGEYTYPVEVDLAGHYFIVAQLEEGVLTRKLVVQ